MNETRFQCRIFSLCQELASQRQQTHGHPEGRRWPRRGAAHTLCSALSQQRENSVIPMEGVWELQPCLGRRVPWSWAEPGPVWALWHNPSAITARRALAVPALPPQGHGHLPKTSGGAWWQQHWAKHDWFKGTHETQWASITISHPCYAFPSWEPIEKNPPL